MHVRVRTLCVNMWKVARWVFRLVPESAIDNNRQLALPTVEIISSRNALICSLPGHVQLFTLNQFSLIYSLFALIPHNYSHHHALSYKS